MSRVLSKINKLIRPQSFIQINLFKGYTYIDKAGTILNEYVDKKHPVKFVMGLNGLIIDDPTKSISQLRVTPNMIWMKFINYVSLDQISNNFNQDSVKLIQILDIKQVLRIGWRNYLIYEFNDKKDQRNYFENLFTIKNAKINQLSFEICTGNDFKASLNINPVIKENHPTHGILFDIDTFLDADRNVDEIPRVLLKIRHYLEDENGFLDIINSTFK